MIASDPSWSVRVEAALSLVKTHTPEALTALIEAPEQNDARVRKEIVEGIGKLYNEEAFAALKKIVAN